MAKILIVEDDDSVRSFVERALMLDSHQCVLASDGGLGLDALRDEGPFDLMLSDIQMPIMDGIALTLKAADECPQMPILLMTGFAEQRERASNLSRIVVDVVSKPFTLPQIREAVQTALLTSKV